MIEPQVVASDIRRQSPHTVRTDSPLSTATNKTWSGVVTNGNQIDYVWGEWVIPTVASTPGRLEVTSFWVGIDRWLTTTPDLPQTGIEAIAGASSDGLLTANHYNAWYEFLQVPNYNQPEVYYPNFPVGPGDTIQATVYTDSFFEGVPYPGTFLAMQLIKQPAGSGNDTIALQRVQITSGTQVTGVFADWVVEKESYPGSTGLANYGSLGMGPLAMQAGVQGALLPTSQNSTVVTMTRDGTGTSTVLSTATLTITGNITFNWSNAS